MLLLIFLTVLYSVIIRVLLIISFYISFIDPAAVNFPCLHIRLNLYTNNNNNSETCVLLHRTDNGGYKSPTPSLPIP